MPTKSIQIISKSKLFDGTPWHKDSVWHPTFHYDEQTPGRMYVFFNGLYQDANTPFDLSIGRIECNVPF